MTGGGSDELTAATFEPHLGAELAIDEPDRDAVALRLDEVTPHRAHPGGSRAEPFSLVFSAPPPVLEQRTYPLRHGTLGTLDIFLVPIGLDADGRVRYEAVFN
jgi:hypothetical protein